MRYLSVCSGMEAASVAWHPLGWKPVGFSEIEPFPCAILKHRFPDTPNYGSLTEYQSWPLEPGSIDLLVGGTPCQSFSVAGLRKGMADPRGNLALVFLGLADKLRPRWIVWENVPGVLSSGGGRDFGSFLGALVELGYGFAYRVLDAQHFGVAQRRRRVFVVAHLGDWRPAAAVFFERESLRGDPAKGKPSRKGTAATSEGGAGTDGLPATVGTICADAHPGAYSGQDAYRGRLIPAVMQPCPDNDSVGTLCARDFKGVGNQFVQEGKCIPCQPTPFRKAKRAQSDKDDETWVEAKESNTLNNFDLGDTRTTHAVVEQKVYENHPNDSRVTGPHEVSPTVVSRFGTGGGNVPLVNNEPIAFQPGNLCRKAGADPSTESFPKLTKDSGDQMPHVCHPVASFKWGNSAHAHTIGYSEQNSPTLTAGGGGNMIPAIMHPSEPSQGVDLFNQTQPMAVRRLTPVECERLQGFPDNWSRIPWKGKPEEDCPDGPRYKACGNSMAVPVMRWIGERIAAVEDLINHARP